MNAVEMPPIVPGRACGTCAMCCKVYHIPELQKAVGVWCPHVVQGKGCSIYDDRPATCRAYFCRWMLDETLGPEWKPDRAKFALHLQRNGVHLQVSVDHPYQTAWMKEPYYSQFKRWARQGADTGQFVFVRIGPRLIVLLPDGERDLGAVGQDDDILISRRMTPTGYEYSVEVASAAAK